MDFDDVLFAQPQRPASGTNVFRTPLTRTTKVHTDNHAEMGYSVFLCGLVGEALIRSDYYFLIQLNHRP